MFCPFGCKPFSSLSRSPFYHQTKGYNANILNEPPPNIGDICADGPDSNDECAFACFASACCLDDGTPSDCYPHFTSTCDAYGPHCGPPGGSSATAPPLAPPAVDISQFCAMSVDVCAELCKDSSCCFQSTISVPSCSEREICNEYSACSILYDG